MTIADAPTTWPDPPPMSTLEGLLLFVGIPLLAMAVITAMVMAPALAKGARSQPGQNGGASSEWFGAPEEVASGAAPRVGPQPAATSDGPTGGASARW